MKSIKPGRGPSLMGGIECIAAAVLGVIMTVTSSSMDAPDIFTAFGVVFVLLTLGNGIYNLVNAARKNRFSTFDVTDGQEEPDPMNARFGDSMKESGSASFTFCPHCGKKLDEASRFCPHCGKELRHE